MRAHKRLQWQMRFSAPAHWCSAVGMSYCRCSKAPSLHAAGLIYRAFSPDMAQPGPLFAFAAYLGAAIRPTPNPVALSALALVSIFLSGMLILVAVLPFWNALRLRPGIQAALRGDSAAVVGILIAAFIRPVWSSAVHSLFEVVLATGAFVLLSRWKTPPWLVVVLLALASAMMSVL